MTAFGQYEDDDSASTLKQRDHKDATDLVLSPAFGMYGPSGQEGATEEEQPTITGSHGQPGNVAVPQAFRKAARAQSSEDDESWVEDGHANTLNVFDVGDTRTTHAIVEPTYSLQGSLEGRSDTAGPGGKGWKEDESFTLNTADRHSIAGASYGVRRLTPVECERLQSFPDGWTEPSGSDSARYKAMGNAVTVNVVRWILSRLP